MGAGSDLGVSGPGDDDTGCTCLALGDFELVRRREDGTRARKLHVSPFLSQFAHDGCRQSH